jgi:hypothetical protein
MSDAWVQINERYEREEVAQFRVVLDTLEEVARHLNTDDFARHRIGLVLTDYIADILLARRVNRVVILSETGAWFEPRERFTDRDLNLLRQGFNRRLRVASQSYERAFTFGAGRPILDADGSEVLRVAHAYRNDVYHEDRHNPRSLPVVARAAIHAVAAVWRESLPSKGATSRGATGPLMDRLAAIGYETPSIFGRGAGPMFSLYAGADAFAGWLERELPFDVKAAARDLADDIDSRVAWAESMVEWLSGFEGPGAEQIEPSLHWHEFWDTHGGDPRLLELADEVTEHSAALLDTEDETEQARLNELLRELDEKRTAHFRSVYGAFTPTLGLSSLPKLRRRGRALAELRQPGRLLARYRTVDEQTRVFEDTLADVAIGWDRHVSEEVDRARGK